MIWSANAALAADPAEIQGGEQSNSALFKEIAGMDTALFDAFNKKDFDAIQVFFSKDLEFFHDKAGLSNYEQNRQMTKHMFDTNKSLRRQLVAGSMQVYPVKDYGAIQTAEHTFCQGPTGTDDCGVFKFLHIWKRTDAGWKLTRVVSYAH